MTAKEYFKNIKYVGDICRIKQRKLEEMESSTVYVSPIISDMPHGNGDPSHKRTDALVKLISFRDEVEGLLVKDVKLQKDACVMIESITDDFKRWLMYSRYIEGLTWKEIVRKSGYSERQIYKSHGEVLKELSERYRFECSKMQ